MDAVIAAELRANAKNVQMKKTDKTTTDQIREHAQRHPQDTYRTIACRYGVSEPTVKRLCRDLGRTKKWRKGRTSSVGDPEKFWAKVNRNAANCWEWLGGTNSKGYGFLHWQGKSVAAHRLAYELTNGTIPAGMEIDHRCRNRRCCNPDHLQPLTRRRNMEKAGVIPATDGSARDTQALEQEVKELIDTPVLATIASSESVVSHHVNDSSISEPLTDTHGASRPVSISAREKEVTTTQAGSYWSDEDYCSPRGARAASVEFVPTPFILQKKTIPRNNIVVGEDAAQIRFLEQQLGVKAEQVDRVTDDMLVGREGVLYRVYASHRIDLSPEMRTKTGFWSAEPIVKGSAAINALVKFAATLLPYPEKKLTREIVNAVGDRLTRGRVQDVRGTIWEAVWLLSGEIQMPKRWRDPWESPTLWLDDSMNINQRLHTLYKRLVGYSVFLCKGSDAAKRLGAKPHELQRFKDMSLNPTKVYQTISLLSRWKQGRLLPYVCALQIAVVWQ
jgi:hypothetical protein